MHEPGLSECFTFSYQNISGLQTELDLYLPQPSSQSLSRPLLVYFHGGGLTVGEKTSWFPHWLHKRTMSAGYAFISANYRLLPPATGHEMLEDIQNLFRFIRDDINGLMEAHGRHDHIDGERIAVIGTSAGGLCASLAGIHVKPKPSAVLSIYGMGGDFFTPHYLAPKSTPFLRGRELLDPKSFPEFIYPNSTTATPTSSSPLSYHGQVYPIPGYPSNPRMLIGRLYLQLGNYIDYYTGEHEPSISERLRACLDSNEKPPLESWLSIIPRSHQPLFPQLNLASFPPTFLIHGSKDTAVPVQESYTLCDRLQAHGITSVLKVCDGMEHSFDYQPEAEEQWGTVFDEAFLFIKDHLSANENISSR